MFVVVISFVRHVMTAAGHHVSEPAVHHSLIYREVDDSLLLTVVDSGKSCLVRLSFNHLNLLDHLCGEVL